MRLLAVNNKSNETNIEKKNSHVLIKDKQGMRKESIRLSMELAQTCYEFESFEDNYSPTISTQECRINKRKFNTRET